MLVQFIANGIVAGCQYALVACSFVVVYLPTRFFNFAHGAVFAWAAYLCFAANVHLQLPLWISVPVAVGSAAGMGIALELLFYHPLRERGATSLVLMLASLGLYTILQNTISLLFGDEIKSLRESRAVYGVAIAGARLTSVQIWTVATSLICFFLLALVLRFSTFGKALRAVSNDPELALAKGIDVRRVTLNACAIGSALAGLSAILLALDVDMVPTMGLNALMMGVVAMIIGGVRSIAGSLLGGLLLGLAQHLGTWRIGSEWQDAIAFVVLLVFLFVRPTGIFGEPSRRVAV